MLATMEEDYNYTLSLCVEKFPGFHQFSSLFETLLLYMFLVMLPENIVYIMHNYIYKINLLLCVSCVR